MNMLNLYFSATGNTEKGAMKIQETAQGLGHSVDTIKITPETKVDILRYDFAFVGSGVYSQLPGTFNRTFFDDGKRGESH